MAGAVEAVLVLLPHDRGGDLADVGLVLVGLAGMVRIVNLEADAVLEIAKAFPRRSVTVLDDIVNERDLDLLLRVAEGAVGERILGPGDTMQVQKMRFLVAECPRGIRVDV
jgi:hypothetical protein